MEKATFFPEMLIFHYQKERRHIPTRVNMMVVVVVVLVVAAGSEVITAVNMMSTVLLVVKPCSSERAQNTSHSSSGSTNYQRKNLAEAGGKLRLLLAYYSTLKMEVVSYLKLSGVLRDIQTYETVKA
jgi:uncharacterized protein YxeA